MKSVYFDNSATTRTDPQVVEAMLPYLTESYGNPSSIYGLGRENRKAVEHAREQVAAAIGCLPEEIYFTAGGSESDNTAIKGLAAAGRKKGNHIITSQIEHPAVLETCRKLEKEGYRVTYLPVDEKGTVAPKDLENAITDETILISIMYANNEIGTIQPIDQLAAIAAGRGIPFHTDAVQAVGSVPIDVKKSNIQSLSMSAHKFYGPKGVGALYVKKGVPFVKFIDGGHQERNKRAGTENVAGIVGLGKAVELAVSTLPQHSQQISQLRDYYEKQILERIPYIKVNGNPDNRLPGNSNISFRFIEGEGLLLNLDLKGICASSGSACTSGSLDPSHVLLAIGLPHEIAHGSLRISMGKYNTKEEVEYLIEHLVEIVNRLREMSPLWEDFLEEEKA